jgi:hypothetical protein
MAKLPVYTQDNDMPKSLHSTSYKKLGTVDVAPNDRNKLLPKPFN